MPDYTDIDRRWIVNGGNLAHVMAMTPVTAPGAMSYKELASRLLEKAGADPADPDDEDGCPSRNRHGVPCQRDAGHEGYCRNGGYTFGGGGPDEGHVTVAALAEALAGTWQIRTGPGVLHSGELTNRIMAARAILDMLDGEDPDPEPPAQPSRDAAVLNESIRTGTPLQTADDEGKGDPNADEVAAFAAARQAIDALDAGAAERVVIHVAGMLGADVQF